MLRERILTALVLLAVLSVVLSLDNPWPFLVFLTMVVALASQEWVRLTAPRLKRLPQGVGMLVASVAMLQAYVWLSLESTNKTVFEVATIVTGLVWVFVIPSQVVKAKLDVHRSSLGWSLFAPVCLYAAWGVLAQMWITGGGGELISLLALVWVADIFAYFGGKRFGRRKLAPTISPGKTVEGAAIGLLGVLGWMTGSALWSGTYAWRVLQVWGWPGVVASALLLGLLAILGDLFESMLKRQAQVKDSGNLLPGHGGVYDRVDAVVAVVPVAYLFLSDFWY